MRRQFSWLSTQHRTAQSHAPRKPWISENTGSSRRFLKVPIVTISINPLRRPRWLRLFAWDFGVKYSFSTMQAVSVTKGSCIHEKEEESDCRVLGDQWPTPRTCAFVMPRVIRSRTEHVGVQVENIVSGWRFYSGWHGGTMVLVEKKTRIHLQLSDARGVLVCSHFGKAVDFGVRAWLISWHISAWFGVVSFLCIFEKCQQCDQVKDTPASWRR